MSSDEEGLVDLPQDQGLQDITKPKKKKLSFASHVEICCDDPDENRRRVKLRSPPPPSLTVNHEGGGTPKTQQPNQDGQKRSGGKIVSIKPPKSALRNKKSNKKPRKDAGQRSPDRTPAKQKTGPGASSNNDRSKQEKKKTTAPLKNGSGQNKKTAPGTNGDNKKSSNNSLPASGSCSDKDIPNVPPGGRPDWYAELTEEQIMMFKKVFELLDKDGGGSIDASELYSVMKDIDIDINLDDIKAVLGELDSDGNGEIDFDEFLYAMAQTDHFLDNMAQDGADSESQEAYSRKQSLFFTAITRFAIKNSMGEIERYYAAKMRQAPHVISFYTAGARLIGLNDHQLEQQLRIMQKAAKNQDSPYAKPLPFVVPPKKKRKPKSAPKPEKEERNSLDVRDYTPQSHSDMEIANMAMRHRSGGRREAILGETARNDIVKLIEELADKGSVIAKLPNVHLVPQIRNKLESGNMDTPICSSLRKRRRTLNNHIDAKTNNGNNLGKHKDSYKKKSACRGWTIPRIARGQAPLPVINIKGGDYTIEDVPKIRKLVSESMDQYYSTLRKAHVTTAFQHWNDLHVDHIRSEDLRQNFRRVYRAYSPHKEDEVFVICPWIPGPRYTSKQAGRPCSSSPDSARASSAPPFATSRCRAPRGTTGGRDGGSRPGSSVG